MVRKIISNRLIRMLKGYKVYLEFAESENHNQNLMPLHLSHKYTYKKS